MGCHCPLHFRYPIKHAVSTSPDTDDLFAKNYLYFNINKTRQINWWGATVVIFQENF